MSTLHFFRQAVPLAAAAALASAAGGAQAAITIYTTPASFTANATQVFTDSFNDLPIDFLPSPATRNNGPYGYSLTAEGGLYGAGTAADGWLSTNLSGASLGLGGFTGGVRGLGAEFFGSDVAGAFLAGQAFQLTATDSVGASVSFTLNDASLNSFVGFVSNGFLTSVSVTPVNTNAWLAVNNLRLSQAPGLPIPEPHSWALMAGGLLGMGWRLRRLHRG